jgi:hypothetical protein
MRPSLESAQYLRFGWKQAGVSSAYRLAHLRMSHGVLVGVLAVFFFLA